MAASHKPQGFEAAKTVTKNSDKTVNSAQLRKMIEEAAYYFAQKRGFEPGHELDDWLAAERHIKAIVQCSTK